MPVLTGTPKDLITYQRELVRTGKYIPLGRINKIAIQPSRDWQPSEEYIARYQRPLRVLEFRNQWLPLAQSLDATQLLVPAPMMNREGIVGLPDIPDPSWRPEPWSEEETTGAIARPFEKDVARMVNQNLFELCDKGPGARLEGTNFMVFQPVLNIVFQPERERQLQAQMWVIQALPDPATPSHPLMALLVDPQTGETIFFGGRYDIVANED